MNIVMLVALFGASIVASLFGQGGGVLYTPIQLIAGVEFQTAATTSLFLIMAISLSSTIVFSRAKIVDAAFAIALVTPMMIGAFFGGLISSQVPTVLLFGVLTALLLISALSMIVSYQPRILITENTGIDSAPVYLLVREHFGRPYTLNLLISTPLMLVMGVLTGMAGIGGGVLNLPIMVLLFGIPIEIAIGTSALMVGITATAGFIGHIVVETWDPLPAIILAIAVFAGGQIGSRISIRADKVRLRKIYGWFLIVVVIIMLVRNFVLV